MARARCRLPILPPCPTISFRPLTLAHGLAFTELYSTAGAARLDGLFVAHLKEADARAWQPALTPRAQVRPTSPEG